ncbi:ALK and LTK ligand 2-like [Brachionichthys hirsutus]|uniref:ALK and LTK ligand 2-like n=1 Tax=Brachionichthys hirsutus TaxID=412623 RepID=UPI0036045C26
MSELRKHFNMWLVLLMCALTGHCAESAPSAALARDAAGAGAPRSLRRAVQVLKQAEESRHHPGVRTEALVTSQTRISPGEPWDLRNLKTDTREKTVVILPTRVLRKKEKFIKHIAGPLYFGPKCRKDVYRLYHHTRDCTIPAYIKRCARLLTRLAGSPRCTGG